MDLVGVIHLLPLPAGPVASPGLGPVLDRARSDARALVKGGLRAAIIENLGDAPFSQGRVEPHVPAMMATIGRAIIQETGGSLALGVNVLRNDARASLGVAAAVGGAFVRVNVHVGAAWTDQGLIQGDAMATLRYRRELGLEPPGGPLPAGWLRSGPQGLRICADVHVKHATPAGSESIGDSAADVVLRGRADVIIVSGRHTGGATDMADVRAVRERVGATPVWIGSGVEPSTVHALAGAVDGAIVGTWLHTEGDLGAPVDEERVRWLVETVAAFD